MARDLTDDVGRQERLEEVLLAYVEEAQAGRAPDRSQVLAAHPDLRPDLEDFFASHDEVERLAAPLRRAGKEGAAPDLLDSRSASGQGRGAAPDADTGASGGATASLGQLGDFRLLREVGRGGMGVVYEAEQISLRRQVALKVLPFAAAIDPRQLQRFRNESLAAAHLHHENIVPVYAVGSERGVHYYAMQFIEGQSLAALIAGVRKLDPASQPKEQSGTVGRSCHNSESAPASQAPPAAETTGPYFKGEAPDTRLGDSDRVLAASISKERSSGSRRYFKWAAGLGRQAALALEHAHQLGIVHRDIKPANLLLDPRGQLWVADFGLAQVSGDAGLTVTGELLGTLRYASPEQALGKKGLVDHRSDIYSLGATLYELLTLRPIFDGRDRHELLRQIAHEEPRPPRLVDRTIPVELETILMKALGKEPGERYATAQELADDFQRFLEDRPIRARRPSLLEKATKWSRRHRSVVASAVAALVLSVAGLSVATFLTAEAYDRERDKAREADEQRIRADASFRQAQAAVKLFEQISEEELAGQPPLQGLRRRLLEATLGYYQAFIDQRRDDPSIRAELETSRAQVQKILGELTTLMGAGEYHLLREKAVQDDGDMKLTPEQRADIDRLDKQFFGRWKEAFRAEPKARQQQLLDVARDQQAAYAKVLDQGQLGRFHQIVLQQRGPLAFLESDVVQNLHLTAEQQKKMRGALDKTIAAALSPLDCGPGQEPEHGPKVWKGGQDTMLALLTPEQRQTWDELVGKRFQGKPGPPRFFGASPFPDGPGGMRGRDPRHGPGGPPGPGKGPWGQRGPGPEPPEHQP